ncbi:MAG: hypothetical protein IMF07_07105 [Proteobacteria bacterium]|nr:hypothetical protein [Pseudomonadota bacterium]
MKNRDLFLLRIAVCAALLLAPVQLFAVQGPQDVSSTAHNLAYSFSNPRQWSSDDPALGPGTEEVCVFCHTPHNAGGELPLWNRYSSSGSKPFLMYSSSATLTTATKQNAGLSADSPSRLCLSCHDGTTAINALINTSATGGGRPDFAGTSDTSFAMTGAYDEGEGAYLGTNLTNSHPINFNYNDAQVEETTAGLKTIAVVKTDLKFFDDDGDGTAEFMECATCHDPHVSYGWLTTQGGLPSGTGDLRYTPFLRKPNVSSALCLTCHNK